MQATQQDLQSAVEELYHVFRGYKLRPVIEACPCGCFNGVDQDRIRSAPLRNLKPTDLEVFGSRAMTTWGDGYDFRHFLPRMYEIIAFEPPSLVDVEAMFGKLEYAKWRQWPDNEQRAIENYFAALWRFTLLDIAAIYDEITRTDTILCAISQAVDDLSPYLHVWQNHLAGNALNHLALFCVFNLRDSARKNKPSAHSGHHRRLSRSCHG